MPFQVNYDAATDCVVTTLSGDLDKDLVSRFFTEVGRVAAENRCHRILSDLRNARVIASTVDIYRMAETLAEKNMNASFRRAIVVSRDRGDYAFWETVCVNRGQRDVKVFEDYEEAKRWVLRPEHVDSLAVPLQAAEDDPARQK